MPSAKTVICATTLMLLSAAARAGLAPENVAVVVNEDSWASKAVANEYVHVRHIPAGNVIYLSLGNQDNFEIVSLDVFKNKILQPVLETIKSRGLSGQIDCIAYSSDIPYAARYPMGSAPTAAAKPQMGLGSLTSLTYFYQMVLSGQTQFGSAQNGYFRRTVRTGAVAAPSDEQRRQMNAAAAALASRDYAGAEKLFRPLLGIPAARGTMHFSLACCLAAQNKNDEAMAMLSAAADEGFRSRPAVERNEIFAALHSHKNWAALLNQMSTPAYDANVSTQPPLGFRAGYAWDREGNRVAPGGQTRQYLLSTMLAVTSGRGNSLDEVRNYLRRSAAADGTCPKGTFYFMNSGDIRTQIQLWAYPAAAEAAQALGVQSQMLKGSIPKEKDIAGLMTGMAGYSWPKEAQVLPGAFCHNLTSWAAVLVYGSERGGGIFFASSQTPLTVLMRHGAAGTCGTVTEPGATQSKFPTPFIQVIYAQGYSLAEALYQTVQSPYELLTVGDALCQPWAKPAKVTLASLAADKPLSGKIEIKPSASAGEPVRQFELFVDGRWVAATAPGKSVLMNTAAGADGYHELRCVAVGADAKETRTSTIVPFSVDNQGHSVKLSAAAKSFTLSQNVQFTVAAKDATRITLMHNTRPLGVAADGAATVSIPAAALGLGTVRVQAVADIATPAGAMQAASPPLELEILPDSPLPAQTVNTAALAPGLLLTAGTEMPKTATTLPAGFKGVSKTGANALEGFVEANDSGLHQFQLYSTEAAVLTVDARTFTHSGKGWTFFPVALAKGFHRVKLAGSLGGRIDLRFGQDGAASLSPKNAWHVRVPGETVPPAPKPAPKPAAGKPKA
ncbi:MAG: hypothetical protein LLG01_05265 [Planctomycetaceae bacterium]|nr:hypothetical protein [Planctomycetaceae bacterium]